MDNELLKKVSDTFNNLPEETRSEIATYTIHTQIMELERSKLRWKRMYDRAIKEINDHVKNLESILKNRGI